MAQGTHQTGIAHVNGTELYYEVAGTGHPFTLIHGLLLDRRSWDDQFEVFAQQYKVLRYDLRGWGDSAQEEAEPPFSWGSRFRWSRGSRSVSREEARSHSISRLSIKTKWTR